MIILSFCGGALVGALIAYLVQHWNEFIDTAEDRETSEWSVAAIQARLEDNRARELLRDTHPLTTASIAAPEDSRDWVAEGIHPLTTGELRVLFNLR